MLSTSDKSCSNGSSSLTSNGHVTDSSWTLVHDSEKYTLLDHYKEICDPKVRKPSHGENMPKSIEFNNM